MKKQKKFILLALDFSFDQEPTILRSTTRSTSFFILHSSGPSFRGSNRAAHQVAFDKRSYYEVFNG